MSSYDEVVDGWGLIDAIGYLGPSQPTAGVYGVNQTSIGFDDAALGRHVLFLGGIGTGKTVGMSALVRSLRAAAQPDDVFVFFDSKGDYIAEFFEEGDVSVAASSAAEFAGAQVWNFFADLPSAQDPDLLEAVTEMCHTLVQGAVRVADNNAIWTQMATQLLAALIVAYHRTGKSYTNVDIRLMADQLTAAQMRAIIEVHGDLRGALYYIARDDSNTTNSVLIFLQQAVRGVFSGNFKKRGSFSIKQFLDQKRGRALFLEYDMATGAGTAPTFACLLDTAFKHSLRRSRAAGRVFVVLDEFPLLPELQHLDAGLNFGRALGMRFVVGAQNVGQVMQTYGEGGGQSVLAGFGTVFSFRLFDQLSRAHVSGRFGGNRRVIRFDNSIKTRGLAEQLVDGSVIEDWDLSSLEVGQAIVGPPSGPPIKFTFAWNQSRE